MAGYVRFYNLQKVQITLLTSQLGLKILTNVFFLSFEHYPTTFAAKKQSSTMKSQISHC